MFLVIIMHDSIVASQKPSNVAPLIAYLFKKNLLNFFTKIHNVSVRLKVECIPGVLDK